MMTTGQRLQDIYQQILYAYGPQHWWPGDSPWEVIVGAILTQSAAWIATQLPLADGGPDGIVLTATMLTDRRSRAVPEMALDRVRIPVLVTHHKDDACRTCLMRDMPLLMDKLTTPPRKELILFEGGINTGDPCEAYAYHGFNGIERDVVLRIANWITAP